MMTNVSSMPPPPSLPRKSQVKYTYLSKNYFTWMTFRIYSLPAWSLARFFILSVLFIYLFYVFIYLFYLSRPALYGETLQNIYFAIYVSHLIKLLHCSYFDV